MNKVNKEKSVEALSQSFAASKAVFFADYKGLTVEQMTDLRRRLRPLNVKVQVVKNNLARLSVKKAKLSADSEKLLDTVVGPTLVTFTFGDPAAVAKVIKKFSEDCEVFGLKDGLLGPSVISSSQISELAKLPSKEVLLAKLLGSMNAPATNFVGVLAAVPRSFVQVLSAIAAKKS